MPRQQGKKRTNRAVKRGLLKMADDVSEDKRTPDITATDNQEIKPKRNPNLTPPVPEKEREAMFQDFMSGTTISAIIKKYNRASSTVHRIKTQDKWYGHRAKIKAGVLTARDNQIKKNMLSNLEYTEKLKHTIAEKLFVDGKLRGDVPITILDFLRVMEYEDKLTGRTPDDSGDLILNFIELSRDEQRRLVKDDIAVLNALSAADSVKVP
jgi:hypothetical protein